MINFGGSLGRWEVLAPPGLTDTGRIRRFQDRTVARLKATAEQISDDTLQSLLQGIAATYREGEGTLLRTVQKRVIAGRDGVSVEFLAGGRHLVYLTALAGEPFPSPGHFIPHNGRSRFYWKHPLHGLPPGMYSFNAQKPAFWKTRQGRDVIAERLGAGAQQFTNAMIREHEAALVEFVQNDLAPVTRSPRVNVASGSGIAPQ
jgi:hypothetical protein